MKNCFMVNTLRHSHTGGSQIKSVCIYSDLFAFLLTSLNRLLVDIQRNSLIMCEQVSSEWEILDKQIILDILPVFFPPLPGPRVWLQASSLALPPSIMQRSVYVHRCLYLSPITECRVLSTDVSSCLPSLSVGLWQQTMRCPYLVSSLPAWAGTR